MQDFYTILDLDYNATDEQIRTQYRQLVRIYHPDRFSNSVDKEYAERKLQEINEAYYGLLAPERTGKGPNRRLTQSQQKYPLLSATPSSVMILLSVLFFGVLLGGLDYDALFSDDPSLAGKTFIDRLFDSWEQKSTAVSEPRLSHEWLSFSVVENYHNVLYVVDANGQPRLEFPLPGREPVWSPQRDQLAFLSAERDGTQIYTLSLHGLSTESRKNGVNGLEGTVVTDERLIRITENTDNKQQIAWSPDGSMLAYIAQSPDADESIIKVLYLENGELVSVTSPRLGIANYVTWLDDANLLADLGDGDARQIFQIPVDGQAAAPFVSFASRDPSVSPTGQRVAVASDEGVYTVLHNGNALTQLTTSPAWTPSWSPTGQQIAYLAPVDQNDARPEKERSALWVTDINGQNPEQITQPGILTYAWSLDGSEIAYITGRLHTQPPTLYLWRMSLDGDETLIAEVSEPHITWGRGP